MLDSLPFDVLGDVFSHYQQGEDDFHPLETLLLVSKSWAAAALGHRAIWARYKIRLLHQPTMDMWRVRLPLRLARSGDNVPIEIDISTEMRGEQDPRFNAAFYSETCMGIKKNGRSFYPCNCNRDHDPFIMEMMDILAGPGGEHRRRWSTFRFYVVNGVFKDVGTTSAAGSVFMALSAATPSLVSLSIRGLSGASDDSLQQTFVPTAPMLKEITLDYCLLPHQLPTAEGLRRLHMVQTRCLPNAYSTLTRATHLEELIMERQSLVLPAVMPLLRHLTLVDGGVPLNLEDVSMPRLTHLSLDLDGRLWLILKSRSSFPLEQLQQLEVRNYGPSARYTPDNIENLLYPISGILCRCNHLQSIVATSVFFSVLLKVMWEVRREEEERKGQYHWVGLGKWDSWNWNQKVVLVSSKLGPIGGLGGDESSERLGSLAQECGLSSPEISWEILLSLLPHGWNSKGR